MSVTSPGALLAAMLLVSGSPALAQQDDDVSPDRPGIADGSRVVGGSRFQIEAGVQHETRHDGAARDRRLVVPLLLRQGFGDRWEGRVESNVYNRQRVAEPGAPASSAEGSSPLSLGFKYQWPSFEAMPHASFGAIVRVFPVSGSSRFRSNHVTADVRLAADWDFAPRWSLNPNLGIAAYEDDANRRYTAALAALTLSFSPTRASTFFVDTGAQRPERKHGSSAIVFDAGVAILATHNLQFDLSLGKAAVGTTPPRRFVAVGISQRF